MIYPILISPKIGASFDGSQRPKDSDRLMNIGIGNESKIALNIDLESFMANVKRSGGTRRKRKQKSLNVEKCVKLRTPPP
jgi:hypothetical protein